MKYWTLAAAMALTGPLQAQSTLARAEVNPSVVMVGETAKYSIRFLNASSVPNLNTPRVDGLDFSDTPGTSSYQQIINGRISMETELSWAFRATREGTFIIPGREIEIGGEEVRIPEVEVQVVPMDEEARSRALLQLELPDPPYYVGQALPAHLSLLVRRDLNLSNIAFPEATGDTFVHSEFDNNPSRDTSRVEGRLYNKLDWDILITPIKSGPAQLQFSQDIAVQISVADNRFPSIFSMSRSRTETYRLFSDDLVAEILPLPKENQPADYRDAIGTFTLSAKLASTDLQVGEPVSFTLTLEGEGNFERISPPELPAWADWRVYPPKVTFVPADARGYTGSKAFEYILIPQSAELTELPAVAYSFFDPVTGAYQTLTAGPQPITVKPSDKPQDEGIFLPDNGDSTQTTQPVVPERILPIRTEYGKLVPAGSTAWKEPRFWISNLLAAMVLLGTAAWLHRRRKLEDDSFLARRHLGGKQVRKALQLAEKAARAGQAGEFLEAARAALQERISHLSKRPIEAKTLVTTDCHNILEENNVPESVKSRIDGILNAADAYHFAGVSPSPAQLDTMHKDLTNALSGLNRLIK